MFPKVRTILTIDDESLIRDTFRFFLEDSGYRVLDAENGRRGLEIINEEQPDLVLLDLRMPDIDGITVLREVNAKYPLLPVIVVSGTGVPADAVEAMAAGAWSYLLKPITDLNSLACAVEDALKKVGHSPVRG